MSRRSTYAVSAGLILAAALSIFGNQLAAPGAQVKGLRRLDFDRANGALTVQAEGASLSEILRQLKQQHRVEVVAPGMVERAVTLNVTNAPLPDVLRRLLPYGTRFHFIVGDADFRLPASTGDKKPGRVEPKPRDLPTKDKTRPTPIDPSAPGKLPPEKVRPGKTDGERGAKPSPKDVRPPEGPKRPRTPEPERGRYARLNLLMRRGGGVEVVRFLRLEGTLIEPTLISGELAYAAFVGGRVVAVGTVQDPLGVRSYREDYGHSADQAETGAFVISLPERFLDRGTLGQTVVRFFYLSESAPRDQPLTPQTFEKFRQYLKPAGEVGARALLKAFDARYARGRA